VPTIDLDRYRVPRPQRADAARNFDAILRAARQVFTQDGPGAPLEDIADRAGVGIATLYRNFASRQVLIENVYLTEVQCVLAGAAASMRLPPWDGLTSWLRHFIDYLASKQAIATAIDPGSALFSACRTALSQAGQPLIRRAQASGDLRTDISDDDLSRYIFGAAAMSFASAQQRHKLLNVLFDGLRART